jgi:hypothetical protein
MFMATEINTTNGGGGGGNVMLAFLLGAVIVFAGIIGFFMWDHYKSGAGAPHPTAVITVKK